MVENSVLQLLLCPTVVAPLHQKQKKLHRIPTSCIVVQFDGGTQSYVKLTSLINQKQKEVHRIPTGNLARVLYIKRALDFLAL